MKNNKGFTLIELIITIALIAALSVVVGLNVMNTMDTQEKKQITEYKEKLENAACVYIESVGNRSITSVTIQQLIDKGLIGKDLQNPETKKPVTDDSHVIKITWTNGKKSCKYE